MDSIDDEWDIDEPATPEQKEQNTSAVKLSSPNLSSIGIPRPSSVPPAAAGVRFSSPLGLSAPAKSSFASTTPKSPSAAERSETKDTETKESSSTKNGASAATIEAVSRLAASTDERSRPSAIPVRNSNPDLTAAKHAAPVTSKVQLVAEAFRQRSGIKKSPVRPSSQPPVSTKVDVQAQITQPSSLSPAPSSDLIAPREPRPDIIAPPAPTAASTVVISPVVVLEEPLELVELKPGTQVNDAVEARAPALRDPTTLTGIPIIGEPVPAEDNASATNHVSIGAPSVEMPNGMSSHVPPFEVSNDVPIEVPIDVAAPNQTQFAGESLESTSNSANRVVEESRDPTPSVASLGSVRDSSLSLDSSYAAEFFSTPPKPQHFELEPEPMIVADPRSVRTPKQLARQRTLRRMVLQGMVLLCAFILVAFYLMWQRGLLHALPR